MDSALSEMKSLAMIAAAKADGQVGADELRRIFDKVGGLRVDAESKAFIVDALATPIGAS